MFLHITGKCQLPPLLLQINQIHYTTGWERGVVWDDCEEQQTTMLSFTEQGRKTVDEIRIHFPGFHQCPSSELVSPNIMYTTHFHTHRNAHNCSLWGFFSHRAWHKELEHQALSWLCGLGVHYSGSHGSVSQPWGSSKLSTTLSTLPTSPSSDRSTWSLSQKSQCPSGFAGKLDKWKARGGKVGRPVILYYAFSFHDSETQWKAEFHYFSRGSVPAMLMSFH